MGLETQDLDEDFSADINKTFNNSKTNLFSYYNIFLNNKQNLHSYSFPIYQSLLIT